MPHRKLKLMMCLFVFSGLISGISSGQAPSRSPSASTVQNDLAIILKDLSEIDAPGAPGGMCVFGPQAFTVIAGTTGKKGDAELPLVSAARFGLGRIAGLGHTGYFGTESLNKFDTGKLIVNLIRWASDKTNPRIGIIREDQLAKYLKNQGLTVIPLPGKDMAGELKNCDILCCNSDRFGDEEARTALLQFIQKGQDLFLRPRKINGGHVPIRGF